MRNGITGFMNFLEEKKIDLNAMGPQDMVMFVNRKKTSIKIVWGRRHLYYYRKLAREGQITVAEILEIPKSFSGQFVAQNRLTGVFSNGGKLLKSKSKVS